MHTQISRVHNAQTPIYQKQCQAIDFLFLASLNFWENLGLVLKEKDLCVCLWFAKHRWISWDRELSRSLCKTSLLLKDLTAPPKLALSANLIKMHLTSVSRSLIKTLKRTSPKTEPWRALPVASCQPDVTPWVQPISQLFTHCTFLAVCCIFCAKMHILRGKLSWK